MRIIKKCTTWTRHFGVLVVTLLVLGSASGCVVKEMGTNLTSTIKGEYYLKEKNPELGEEVFLKEVEAHPENPPSNYYYGRLLLRSDKAKAALPFLQKAGSLDPENPDYQFWIGVTQGLLKQTKQERLSYERALTLDDKHEQALTSLGHWHLQKKEYSKALQFYTKALLIWPENSAALYNRALALSKLGKRQEEQAAWHRYLGVSSSGWLARNAVEHLNSLNDFSYRNYQLGPRMLTVEKIRFSDSSAEVDEASLSTIKMIGEIASTMKSGVLQVVVYQKNDVLLARARAQSIRKILLRNVSGLREDRIGISWFGEPQRNAKKRWVIEESVDFFLVNK